MLPPNGSNGTLFFIPVPPHSRPAVVDGTICNILVSLPSPRWKWTAFGGMMMPLMVFPHVFFLSSDDEEPRRGGYRKGKAGNMERGREASVIQFHNE